MTGSISQKLLVSSGMIALVSVANGYAENQKNFSVGDKIISKALQVFSFYTFLRFKNFIDTGIYKTIPLRQLTATLLVVSGLELIEYQVNKNRGSLKLQAALKKVNYSLGRLIVVINTLAALYVFKKAPRYLQKESAIALAGMTAYWGIKWFGIRAP